MAEELGSFFGECSDSPGFRAEPWYNRAGDCLEFHFAPDEYYAERVDDVLTVYRGMPDDKLVGCQVKGISALLRKFGDFGVRIETHEVQLALLFFVSHLVGGDPQYEAPRRQKLYNDLLARVGGQKIDMDQLVEG